jgi:hypothetical protein
MNAVNVARALAVGRVAIGGALLVSPRLASGWIGPDGERESATVLTRALGVRDMAMGLIALHTAAHPQVGPRWQRTLAGCDAVDLAGTLLARRSLPAQGVAGVAAIAGTAIVGELWAASKLAA